MSNKSTQSTNHGENKSKLTNLFTWFLNLVRDEKH